VVELSGGNSARLIVLNLAEKLRMCPMVTVIKERVIGEW
jgi:hypothetical protein